MTTELTQQMADSLRAVVGLDLKDERACMRALVAAGYRSGDIAACVDGAMSEAQHRGLKLAGVIADAAGAVAALAVWGFAYCITCPPGSF